MTKKKYPTPYTETTYGFTWGAATIERCASGDDGSVVLSLRTAKEYFDVRVTRTGVIRLGEVVKIDKQKAEA